MAQDKAPAAFDTDRSALPSAATSRIVGNVVFYFACENHCLSAP
jgi:hypothetical protein